MCFCIPHATVISDAQVGSGPMCLVLVLDVFGLTTFVVLAENQILVLVHTEAGVFIRVLTQKMSRYRALQLRLKLYPVRCICLYYSSKDVRNWHLWDFGIISYHHIWLDNVRCTGRESDIGSCPHLGWGVHSCTHSEDVSILCTTIETQALPGKHEYSTNSECILYVHICYLYFVGLFLSLKKAA